VILVLAVAIGALYAGGVYMMLRRSITKLLVGLALLSHAANLLIFVGSGLKRGLPPLLPEHGPVDDPAMADPLPQALILTAIVINLGLLAFVTALLQRSVQASGTDDLHEIRMPEQ
jgi:multicomponent Na+:H+ antiporter subunit C